MSNYQVIKKALLYIAENSKNQPSLKELSEYCHLSEGHFQRIFTEWAGISPKKFLRVLNVEYAKSILNEGGSIEDATYTIGLSSTSRLHDLFVDIEAMTPAEYKNGGRSLTINYSFDNCKYGEYLVASTSKGICELIFKEKKDSLNQLKNKWPNAKLIETLDKRHTAVKDFINNKLESKEKIKLHIKGTNFQIKVWQALLKIPEGNLKSYSQIAKSIKTKGFRAVGTAIGDNPIAYIIPCHRVIKSTGVMGNYRWGKAVKLSMLGYETGKLED